MFSDSRLRRFAAPMPPTPTPAMFIFSLGGICLGPPSTCRGTIVAAAAAPANRALVFTKSRRVKCLLMAVRLPLGFLPLVDSHFSLHGAALAFRQCLHSGAAE